MNNCPDCDGTGFVEGEVMTCNPNYCRSSEITKCDVCDGTGEVQEKCQWEMYENHGQYADYITECRRFSTQDLQQDLPESVTSCPKCNREIEYI